MFRRYNQRDNNRSSQSGSPGGQKGPMSPTIDKSTYEKEELVSLQQMIEDNSWKESEERFFEVILELPTESTKDYVERNQFFLQIKRVHVQYSNRPAIMIVIRNISLIVEFEQIKSENKYQELLTATMSHEMLTPLNSIINLAVYLEEKIKLNM